jgi:predicted RNase H-like HicB family nuclease
MERTFEATIEKRDKWYVGWVEAVPGAFSQGRTIREVQENLKEAVQLILESQALSFPKSRKRASGYHSSPPGDRNLPS